MQVSGRAAGARLDLDQICPAAITAVNPKIAPATLDGWDFARRDDDVLEFFGHWGLIYFTVAVELFHVFHGTIGKEKDIIVDQLLRLAPAALADSIARIARHAAIEETATLRRGLDDAGARLKMVEQHYVSIGRLVDDLITERVPWWRRLLNRIGRVVEGEEQFS